MSQCGFVRTMGFCPIVNKIYGSGFIFFCGPRFQIRLHFTILQFCSFYFLIQGSDWLLNKISVRLLSQHASVTPFGFVLGNCWFGLYVEFLKILVLTELWPAQIMTTSPISAEKEELWHIARAVFQNIITKYIMKSVLARASITQVAAYTEFVLYPSSRYMFICFQLHGICRTSHYTRVAWVHVSITRHQSFTKIYWDRYGGEGKPLSLLLSLMKSGDVKMRVTDNSDP